MTNVCAHRGPDGGAVWHDGFAALGHRRLAIIDQRGGTQPMVIDTTAGSVVLTYAGELYNYRELRHELQLLGDAFDTASDSEVLARAYLRWGIDVLSRLNGMFAFALWDARLEELIMARDRLGIKPLFYRPTHDGVVFASEPKSLFAHPLIEPVVDEDGLRRACGILKTPGMTIWKDVAELAPATYAVVGRNGVSTHTYWRLLPREHRDDLHVTTEQVAHLLSDSTAAHILSEVPHGALLSGGVDSSLVTALAARADPLRPLRTFSLNVDGERFTPDPLRASQDASFARVVAHHIGTNHHELVVDAKMLADVTVREQAVQAMDAPSGIDDIDQSLFLLFRRVRTEATVALCGEGADECFGGYAHFFDPRLVARPMFPWLSMSAPRPHLPAVRMFDLAVGRRLRLGEYFHDCYRQALMQVPRSDFDDPTERRMRELVHVHLTHLLPALLDRHDRLSMASGLEVRVPYCDHRVVEYAFNIPWRLKAAAGTAKGILRRIAAAMLPHDVAYRSKAVYPSTSNTEYVSLLKTQVRDIPQQSEVFDVFSRPDLDVALSTPSDAVHPVQRMLLERVLNWYLWIRLRRPTIRVT